MPVNVGWSESLRICENFDYGKQVVELSLIFRVGISKPSETDKFSEISRFFKKVNIFSTFKNFYGSKSSQSS